MEELVYPEEAERPIGVGNFGIPQIYYDDLRNSVHVAANEIRFVKTREYSDIFQKLDTDQIWEKLRKFNPIHFVRTYAMGDVILCLPVFRYLRQELPFTRFVLRTKHEFFPLFRYHEEIDVLHSGTMSFVEAGSGLVLNFDNVFEWDHSLTHPFKDVHRTDILYHLLGVPQEKRSYNYDLKIGLNEELFVHEFLKERDIPAYDFIVMSWKGSTRMKTLPLHVRKEVARKLAESAPVVIIDSVKNPEGMEEIPNVHWFCGHPATYVLSLFQLADFSLVSDSGALWFSHAVGSKVICMFGPTNSQTRLIHHPLYKSGGCKELDLRVAVGCPGVCNEKDIWCHHTTKCFSEASADYIVDQISNLSSSW